MALLYSYLATDLDKMLYHDVVLLIESIEQLKKEINNLLACKNGYKMNVEDQRYIDNTIDEELHLLNFKKQ